MKINTDDRPGSMDKIYADNNGSGKITQYFDKYKTLAFTYNNGKTTVMTYGTFKKSFKEMS